jgi:hypothetical protein
MTAAPLVLWTQPQDGESVSYSISAEMYSANLISLMSLSWWWWSWGPQSRAAQADKVEKVDVFQSAHRLKGTEQPAIFNQIVKCVVCE